jgi:hypothetical protein
VLERWVGARLSHDLGLELARDDVGKSPIAFDDLRRRYGGIDATMATVVGLEFARYSGGVGAMRRDEAR